MNVILRECVRRVSLSVNVNSSTFESQYFGSTSPVLLTPHNPVLRVFKINHKKYFLCIFWSWQHLLFKRCSQTRCAFLKGLYRSMDRMDAVML